MIRLGDILPFPHGDVEVIDTSSRYQVKVRRGKDVFAVSWAWAQRWVTRGSR